MKPVAMKAIIAEDEAPLARELAEALAALWPDLEIAAIAEDGTEALEAIMRLKPHVAFLDIRMPGLSGLEVANAAQEGTRIVFVTAHEEHALAAFDARAVDYLLKPLSRERLAETVARLQSQAGSTDDARRLREALDALTARRPAGLKWINCSSGDTIEVVDIDHVLMLQSRDKYTCVVTREREHYVRTPLKELFDRLDPELFWPVHRGTVVRVSAVRRARREGEKLLLELDGIAERITVSQAHAWRFRPQ
jgi:DNA-binding LytR/AlgR family response regulator